MPHDSLAEQMLRRIQELERQLSALKVEKEKYSILNVNSPAQITANQNDYDPGNYDFLLLYSDALRAITGISGGYMGRRLIINIYGSNNIVFAYNSGSSQAANRILTPTAGDITLVPGHSAYLVYSTAWIMVLYV